MACVTRHAALMSVSLASWRSCAKMRSSWTHWKSGTASSARRCDTSCMGDNFSHHCACNLVDHSHGLKVFPLHGCALVQLPDLGSPWVGRFRLGPATGLLPGAMHQACGLEARRALLCSTQA